jgi:hypothetical protein
VAIKRLLQGSAFGPDQIDRIVAAYEEVLRALRLANRIDPITEFVAKTVFEIAQAGELDTARIKLLALEEFGKPSVGSFDKGILSERASELQRVATVGLSNGEAVTALAKALANEVASVIARHPHVSIVEMMDLVFRGITKETYLSIAPDDDEARMDTTLDEAASSE